MKVLVVSKTTNLDIYGESIKKKIAQGYLTQEHLENLEIAHKEHYETLDKLSKSLSKNKIEFQKIGRGKFWPEVSKLAAVITVGGDGTVLEASHHIHNEDIPLIGIRSSQMSVGFLCAFSLHSIEDLIDRLFAQNTQKIPYKSIHRLQANIQSASTGASLLSNPILNDILYSNVNPAATTRYNISFKGQREAHKSSGIWVATAAGSTAAIKAAGGVAMSRTESLFQFAVREIYQEENKKPHSLLLDTFDPLVHPLVVENLSAEAMLALDGQHGALSLGFGDKITFQRGPRLKLASA